MKTIDGINNDAPLINVQTGAARLAKNMVISKDKTCRQIEGGEKLEITLDYAGLTNTKILGIIDCNLFDVVIGVHDTNKLCIFKHGEIGLMPILITQYITMNPLEIVEGVFQVNSKGETIIAFWNGTQKTSSYPRLINIDSLPFDVDGNFEITGTNPELLAELTLLQLNRTEPIISTYVAKDEGSIFSGKYSFCINYILEDDETTTTIPSPSVFAEDVRDEVVEERRSHFRGVDWGDQVISRYRLRYRTSTPESIINAALVLSFANLDTRYKSFNLNVIHYNSGNIRVYQIKDIQFATNTLNYTIYKLKDLDEISLNSILETTFKLDTVQSGKVFKNKLYIGGFKNTEYNYQPFANGITTRLGIREKLYNGIETFLPDEAYAFYAHIVYKNGNIGKGCFISGRLPEGNELDDLSAVTFNGVTLNNSSNYKRFHINNPVGSNQLGYWENKTYTYDSWLDENKKIFGVDSNGNAEDSGDRINDSRNYIRLVKFPSVYDIGAITGDYGVYPDIAKQYQIYPIFDNIKIPNDLKEVAQGLIFSYAKKNSSDFHILGYGDISLGGWATTYPTASYNGLDVRSFDLLTIKPKLDVLCVKDLAIIGNGKRIAVGPSYIPVGLSYIDAGSSYIAEYHDYYNIKDVNVDDSIYPINNSLYRPANNSAVLPTNNGQDENLHLEMKMGLTTTFGCINIPAWEYKHIWGGTSTDVYPDNEQGVLQIGNTYTTHSYGCLISSQLDLHGNILNEELVNCGISISFTEDTEYTTDGLIPKGDSYMDLDLVRCVSKQLGFDGITYDLRYANILYPVYSRLPVELRTFVNLPYIWLSQYMSEVTRIFYFNQYNMYYEGRVLDTNKIPLVSNLTRSDNPQFDKYLVRSNVLDVVSNKNGWRTFLPLTDNNLPNFLVTDLDKGSILQLNINNKAMYIQTTETLYMAGVQDKLTSQVTLEETDVFQLTPNEIVLSDKSRISCFHKTACILIPEGYIVVDRKNNKILMIQSSIDDIKSKGFDNLISKHLKRSGYRSTTDDNISIGYDNEYNRIVIHFNNRYQDTAFVGFTDAPIETPVGFQSTFPIGGQTINTRQLVPIIQDGEIYLAPFILEYGEYKVNCAILINYHQHAIPELLGNPKQISFNYTPGIGWVSYSSHVSERIFHTSNKLFGIKGYKLYSFNYYTKTNSFFDGNLPQESFVDIVFNITKEQLNSIIDAIQIRTDVIDENDDTVFDATINKYVVYTDGQCSGEILITNFINSIFNKTLNRVHNVFHLNKFKDKVTDYRLPFIDEYGALSNIDYTMPFFKQSAFHNKVFVVRLGIVQNAQMQALSIKNIKLIDIDITLQKHIR